MNYEGLSGWMLDIMRCIKVIDKSQFTLQEMYDFEVALKRKHPDNGNIKPKIRQQLQLLSKRGHIKYLGDGIYELTNSTSAVSTLI